MRYLPNMDMPAALLERHLSLLEDVKTPWQHMVDNCCAMNHFEWFQMHRVLENTFGEAPAERVIAVVNSWIHESSKLPNKGMILNAKFKQYREKRSY